MCPPNVLQDTLRLLLKLLKSPGCRKTPVLVRTKDDVVLSATNFVSERLCPIFQVHLPHTHTHTHNLERLQWLCSQSSLRYDEEGNPSKLGSDQLKVLENEYEGRLVHRDYSRMNFKANPFLDDANENDCWSAVEGC